MLNQTTETENLGLNINTNYSGTEELWVIEKNLTHYNFDLVKIFSQFFKPKDDILEFGAGIGTLAQLWFSIMKIKPQCLEIDKNLNRILEARGFYTYDNLESILKKFDGIYTSNVLEHVQDDVGILKKLHSKLKDDSIIVIYVPAFMCLYSRIDAKFGHFRRYKKSDLHKKLKQSEFQLLNYRYVDSIGFFVWLLVKLGGTKYSKAIANGQSLQFYDRYIYPFSKFLDNLGFKYFLGKNLLVVAKKIAST